MGVLGLLGARAFGVLGSQVWGAGMLGVGCWVFGVLRFQVLGTLGGMGGGMLGVGCWAARFGGVGGAEMLVLGCWVLTEALGVLGGAGGVIRRG